MEDQTHPMSIFEAAMLLCFGISWPISIAKTLRTKVVAGKSPVFMLVIIIGYACGIVHKILFAYDWIIFLYALNMTMVAVDLALYVRYSRGEAECTAARIDRK
jgi:hypothetical protein